MQRSVILKKRVDGAFITATRRWREERVAPHPSQILVRDGSNSSLSILTIGSGDTSIVGTPPSQVVNLVTPSTAMTKASSVDIETGSTIPRDTIRRKTGRRLHQHNAEKRNLKKGVDVIFITATRR